MSSKPKAQNPPMVRRPPGQGTSRSARRRRAARARSSGQQNVVGSFSRPVAIDTRAGYTANSFAKAYAAVIDNPFLNIPVRLGFGTLVPTALAVARVTTVVTANADGTLLVLAKPNAQNPVAYSNAASAVAPSWANITDGSWTTANNQYGSARPIAMGLKVTPLSAGTDKCSRAVGVAYAYETSDNLSSLAGLDGTPASTWFSTHLGSKEILASGGNVTSMMAWRPMSLENFEFRQDWLTDTSAILTTPRIFPMVGPVCITSVAGPASQQYDIECIYYYEALLNANTVSPGSVDGDSSASDYFPSLEKFYKAASTLLTKENVLRVSQLAELSSVAWRSYAPIPKFTPLFVDEKSDDHKVYRDDDVDRGQGHRVLPVSGIPVLRRV